MSEAPRPKDQVDVLSMLRSAPHTLDALAADATPGQLRAKATQEEWSISEIVAHLVDAEQAWFSRIRLMAEQDRPEMKPFANPDYGLSNIQESLQTFHSQRQADLDYLDRLEPEQWGRGGEHSRWGTIDILWAARHLAAHDAEHLAQIARVRKQLRQ
jgi:uncharacterized damage-inducible protein DinB